MSRIGKKAIALPKGVTASVDGQTVKVKGPKGELSVKLVQEVTGGGAAPLTNTYAYYTNTAASTTAGCITRTFSASCG